MAKAIKFKGKDWKTRERDGFSLFLVLFEDENGKEYSWAPKWKDISDIFNEAIRTETWNEGDDWFGLMETALRVITMIANNHYGRKLRGPYKPQEHKGNKYLAIQLKEME